MSTVNTINEVMQLIDPRHPNHCTKEVDEKLTSLIDDLVKMADRNHDDVCGKFYELKEKLRIANLGPSFDKINSVILRKWPLTELPEDVWVNQILSVSHENLLFRLRCVSQEKNRQAIRATNNWVNTFDISLDRLNLENTQQAVNYVSKYHLSVANFDFHDVTYQDLETLAQSCGPTLKKLMVCADGLQGIPHGFNNLELLDLYGGSDLTVTGLAPLKDLTRLQTLDLSDTHVTDDSLSLLRTLTKLRKLVLGEGDQLTNDGLRGIGQLTELLSLELQSMRNLRAEGLTHLSGFTRLQILKIGDSKALKDEELAPLKNLIRLESFELDSSINGAGLTSLLGINTLTKIVISSRRFQLNSIENFTRLKTLKMKKGEFEDADLVHLTKLQMLRNLQFYQCDELKGDGLIYLTGMNLLTKLDLRFCDDLSVEGISQVRELTSLQVLKTNQSFTMPKSAIEALQRPGLRIHDYTR